MSSHLFARLAVVFCLIVGLVACAEKGTPLQVGAIDVQPGTTIQVNEAATLTVQASGSNLQFKWTATHGTISDPTKMSVLYTAPASAGPDTVTVQVTSEGSTNVQSVTLQIVPSNTPTVTARGSITSAPTPPSQIAAPTFTPAPTPTPAATGDWTWNITQKQAPQTFALYGQYPASLSQDIWVFVQPLGDRRLYPQSMKPCEGAPTAQRNGKWEVQISLGRSKVGEDSEVTVRTASGAASRFIADKMIEWCKNNDDPGLSEEELPQGLNTQLHATLKRTASRWGAPPTFSDAQLPGRVKITNAVEQGRVPQELVLRGTFTDDVTNNIWVLVYAPNGLWYPQSTDACKGQHTEMGSGGQWSVRATFGGDKDVGQPYYIAVVLADAQASTFFDQRQRSWCANKLYPGLLTLDLPPGIAKQVGIWVYRQ